MRTGVAVVVAVLGLALTGQAQAATRTCSSDDGSQRYVCEATLRPETGFEQIFPAGCDRFRDFIAYAVSSRIGTDATRDVPLPRFLLRDEETDLDSGRVHRMRVRVTVSNTRRRVTAFNRSPFAVRVSYSARCRV